MKKLILAILLIAIAFPVFAADKEEESVYERVIRTGTIRCGYGVYPPVLAKNLKTDEFEGIAYDFMEAMGKNLGLKIEWVEEAGWGGLVSTGLKNNRFDAFCSAIWRDSNRAKAMDFTDTLFLSLLYAYVRVDEDKIKTLADINNEAVRIGTMDGEMTDILARTRFPKAQSFSIPQLANFTDIFMNIKSNKADITFAEPSMANLYMEENPGVLKKLMDDPIQVFSNTIAVKYGEPDFKSMLNTAIMDLQNRGTMNKILDSHSGTFLRVVKSYEVPQ